jgi:CheY-like chemotaxis protein
MPGETILVVEDNEVQREGLAAVLGRQGYTVCTAANGREAMGCLEMMAPDLVLLDMLTPPPDGGQVPALRNKTPGLESVPVLIMTALGVASEKWAAGLGACGLLRKPLEAEALLAHVRRCLDKRRAP